MLLVITTAGTTKCDEIYLELRDIRDCPVSNAWVVVPTTDDAEEAVLTPVGTPTITTDPIVHTILSTPTIQLDGMISNLWTAGIIHVDATGVVFNAVRINIGRDWSTSIDFGHDVVVTSHGAILADGNLGVFLHGSC